MTTTTVEPPAKPPAEPPVAVNDDDPWEILKTRLEEAIFARLPEDNNAPFRLLTTTDWVGECPSPGIKARSAGMTTHQVDRSRVCLDCYGIHVLPSDLPRCDRDEVIERLASFIVTNYHKRTLAPE